VDGGVRPHGHDDAMMHARAALSGLLLFLLFLLLLLLFLLLLLLLLLLVWLQIVAKMPQ